MAEFVLMILLVYGEARSGGEVGMTAVANVAINRAEKRGTTVAEEILRKKQFSYFNSNWKLVKRDFNNFDYDKDMKSLKTAVKVVFTVFFNLGSDITGEATFYHTTAVNPYWTTSVDSVKTIGSHIFYK